VDGRVPVVAAVERGRQLARRARVGVALEHVGDLVRVLAVDAVESKGAEALGKGGVEGLSVRRSREDGRAEGDR
jgi:hypothetical protein